MIVIVHLSIEKVAVNAPGLFVTFAESVVPILARGATVFVVAFPVLNEIEWRTVDGQYFLTQAPFLPILVFLPSVKHVYILLYKACL